MFLIDISKGVPNGCKYYDPDIKKWFAKNHYSTLFVAVQSERLRRNLSIQNLDKIIQQFICEHLPQDAVSLFCSDGYKPIKNVIPRKCGGCGGGKKR